MTEFCPVFSVINPSRSIHLPGSPIARFIYKPSQWLPLTFLISMRLLPLTFLFPSAVLVLRSLAWWKRSRRMHMARIDGCFQTAIFTLSCMLPGVVMNFLHNRKPLLLRLWCLCVSAWFFRVVWWAFVIVEILIAVHIISSGIPDSDWY